MAPGAYALAARIHPPRAPRSTDLVIYELHVGTFTPRGHVPRRHRQARRPRGTRRHRPRTHAAGRFPRPLELGLRRRVALRALARLRPARRPPRAHRRRPRARPRRHARRRLQPPRTRRQLPRRVHEGLLQSRAQNALGRRAQLRRPAQRPRARVFPGQHRSTGWRNSISTASGSTRSTPSSTIRTRHILADIAAAVHERGGFVFAEDERNAAFLATPGGRRRHAGWTACGRTISTTACASR